MLIIDLTLVILIIGPFVIGYGIVIIFLNIVDTIRDHLPKHQPVYRLSKDDLKRIDWEMNLPVPKLGNTVVPVKKPDLPPSKPAKINLHDGFFYAKDLTEDQINMCKNNGYVEITTNPFGPGKGPRVLIKSPDNQSSIHYYFCRILKSEIEKYGHDALMYASVRPDIVANDIAFEVETGSHYRKKDLRDKFKRAKRRLFRLLHPRYKQGT